MTRSLQDAIVSVFETTIPKLKEGAAPVESIQAKFSGIDFDFEPTQPDPLPAFKYCNTVLENAPAGVLQDLAVQVDAFWEQIDWFRNPNYIHDESLGRFRNWYGYNQYVGSLGMIKSREIAVGMILIGPNCLYPSHSHLAEEIYVPISGRAEWWTAESGWQIREPGTPIFHRSWLAHATRTADEPLLALYGWLGDSAKHAKIDKKR